MPQKRSLEIDALKGWAIFLVVIGHAVIYFPIDLHQSMIGDFLYRIAVSVHIPLFFAVSGYCYKMKGSYDSYIGKKALRIMVPYIIFNLVDMIPRYFLGDLVNRPRSISESILNVILYGGEYWFLYVLFIIFLIYPCFDIICKNSKKRLLLLLMILFVLSSCQIDVKLLQLSGVCKYLFWFHIGHVIKNMNVKANEIKWESRDLVVSIITLTIWILSVILNKCFYGSDIIIAFMGCFFSITMLRFKWFTNFFSKYGKNSLQIYLLNGFLLVISRTFICKILGISNPFVIIAFNVFVDYFIANYIIEKILLRFQITRFVMGTK